MILIKHNNTKMYGDTYIEMTVDKSNTKWQLHISLYMGGIRVAYGRNIRVSSKPVGTLKNTTVTMHYAKNEVKPGVTLSSFNIKVGELKKTETHSGGYKEKYEITPDYIVPKIIANGKEQKIIVVPGAQTGLFNHFYSGGKGHGPKLPCDTDTASCSRKLISIEASRDLNSTFWRVGTSSNEIKFSHKTVGFASKSATSFHDSESGVTFSRGNMVESPNYFALNTNKTIVHHAAS